MSLTVDTENNNFKSEIGMHIKTEKCDCIILDQKIINRNDKHGKLICEKSVLVHCVLCGKEYWNKEYRVTKENPVGCRYCSRNRTLVKDALPEFVEYFKKYDLDNLYMSHKEKLIPICPYCGDELEPMWAYNIKRHRNVRCHNCHDKLSYPERYFDALMKNLKISYKRQLTCRDFMWIGSKRYDVWFPDVNTIVELNGKQHDTKTLNTGYMKDAKLQESNDIEKKILALKNGIQHYIEIDCYKSDPYYIMNSIQKSKLGDLLNVNFEEVDVIEIAKKALDPRKKDLLEYRKLHPEVNDDELAIIFNCSRSYILDAQKQSGEYNRKHNLSRAAYKANKTRKPMIYSPDIQNKISDLIHDGYYNLTYISQRIIEEFGDKTWGRKKVGRVVDSLYNLGKIDLREYKQCKSALAFVEDKARQEKELIIARSLIPDILEKNPYATVCNVKKIGKFHELTVKKVFDEMGIGYTKNDELKKIVYKRKMTKINKTLSELKLIEAYIQSHADYTISELIKVFGHDWEYMKIRLKLLGESSKAE